MRERGSDRAPGHWVRRSPGGAVVLQLLGEHDLATRDATDELLAQLVDSNDVVVVDLSETSYIDSSILHSIVRAHQRAAGRGSKLRVQLGSAAIVRKMFEVSELTSYLDVVPEREQALHS